MMSTICSHSCFAQHVYDSTTHDVSELINSDMIYEKRYTLEIGHAELVVLSNNNKNTLVILIRSSIDPESFEIINSLIYICVN